MKFHSKTSLLLFFLVISAPGTVSATTITHIFLSEAESGLTTMEFDISGQKDEPGGGSNILFANLIGGDPFSESLQFYNVSFDPIAVDSGLNLVGLQFDSDGGGLNQDDFTLLFDDLVYMGDNLNGSATRVLDIDFALFTAGTYSRSNAFGDLTLSIQPSPVPVPAGLPLLASALGVMVWSKQRRQCKLTK